MRKDGRDELAGPDGAKPEEQATHGRDCRQRPCGIGGIACGGVPEFGGRNGDRARRGPGRFIEKHLKSGIRRDFAAKTAEELVQLSRRGADPKWAATLDTLRPPPENGKLVSELNKTRKAMEEELRGLNDDEQKQRIADIKHWEAWLGNVDGDIDREPARIRDFYSVKSHRIEPVGLVYQRSQLARPPA